MSGERLDASVSLRSCAGLNHLRPWLSDRSFGSLAPPPSPLLPCWHQLARPRNLDVELLRPRQWAVHVGSAPIIGERFTLISFAHELFYEITYPLRNLCQPY